MSESLSVYIHVPFCVRKCGYCDFFSVTDLSRIDAWTLALMREIEHRSHGLRGAVTSLYFGGGTPSVLPVRSIDRILSSVQRFLNLSPDAEMTLELNPGTADDGYYMDLRNAGINRLSIGAQSFSDKKLKFLGRIHTAHQARAAFAGARKAGFENIGMDLIYGLPAESRRAWETDLEHALSFSPEHLSCYMLTLEKGTPLYAKARKKAFEPRSPEDQTVFFQLTSNVLTRHGFIHYEISNFAKGISFISRHNSRYWQRKPYLGFGPAAHSYDGRSRSWNAASLDRYIDDIHSKKWSAGRERLEQDQAMLESVMLALRTSRGLDIPGFDREFGGRFEARFGSVLSEIRQMRLGAIRDGHLSLNLEGMSCLNSILERFADLIFPDAP